MKSLLAAFFMVSVAAVCSGQTSVPVSAPTPAPKVVVPALDKELPVAVRNNVYCAGYIQTSPINTDFEIVGANAEPEKNALAQGDEIYVSRGANSGVKVGDVFSVVRPRGEVNAKLSAKGKLGMYVQEVGSVEIIRVKNDVSIARVKTSCDNLLFGDLLQPMNDRQMPLFTDRPALDLYAEPTGKAVGRIVLARDNVMTVSRDQIVYIDLGAEDNVRVGDYLTVFRPLGKGSVKNIRIRESGPVRDEGFESNTYRNGEFSSQMPRKEGGTAEGSIRTSIEAQKNRPANLRKIVGEMMIVNVKERTATAVVTRNAQEIHTGDMVEVQ